MLCRLWAAGLFLLLPSFAQTHGKPSLSPDMEAIISRVSPDSMRGNLSFLASDLLEGRDTPSRGLDLAAEFIASQFREARLEPAGDDGYFQTSKWRYQDANLKSLEGSIDLGDLTWKLAAAQARVMFLKPLELTNVAAIKVSGDAKDLTSEEVSGKVILVEMPPAGEGNTRERSFRQLMQLVFRLDNLKPALIIGVDKRTQSGDLPKGRLTEDDISAETLPTRAPLMMVYSEELSAKLGALPAGVIDAKVSLRIEAPVEHPVILKNVVGLLPGSDPELRNTYILVTAHYDHIGMGPAESGDRIFNGANDDGSGTVSVIELAKAMGLMKERPKRSIVFMTVFGEEKGLLGSRHYARKPIFPLAKTVANINLEQVGRTDSSEGPQVATASFTGFAYSDVPKRFQEAGELTGVKVYADPDGDSYFDRSDNASFARFGVPAHTMCVAYVYPDYHGLADHWEKIDYDNMAKVDRMVAAGLLLIANDPEPPKWDEDNPKTERYRKAQKAAQQ